MTAPDYIPRRDGDRRIWLHSYKTGMEAHGAALGLSTAEIAAIAADCDELTGKIEATFTAKAALKAATSAKDKATASILKRLRRHTARVKTHPDYTVATGMAIGIGSPKSAWDAETAAPVLRLQALPGKVVIRYKKEGSQGIKIWCKRGAEPEFTFLAQDMQSPFYDNRPNLTEGAEQRSYYAIFIGKNDVQLGQRSNISVINV